MADAPKPPEPQRIEPDTEFVKNPFGAIHDVNASHPSVELAKKGDGGWHIASDDEIADYCERNKLDSPKKKLKLATSKEL